MRGTPWIRTLLLALVLTAAGIGLTRLIQPKATPTRPPVITEATTPISAPTRFELRLSASATEITLDGGSGPIALHGASPVTGRIPLDPKNPTLAITVRWFAAPAPGEYRFARIILMPPGRPTLTHVFEATGDIDDFIELPLP